MERVQECHTAHITAVPVQKTRCFWHNTGVHSGKESVPMSVTLGVFWKFGSVVAWDEQRALLPQQVIAFIPDTQPKWSAERHEIRLARRAGAA